MLKLEFSFILFSKYFWSDLLTEMQKNGAANKTHFVSQENDEAPVHDGPKSKDPYFTVI